MPQAYRNFLGKVFFTFFCALILLSSAAQAGVERTPIERERTPVSVTNIMATANSGMACTGYREQNIYPVRDYNGRNVCPTSSSRLIYVSATGNDASSGNSADTPVRTFMRAAALMGQQRCNCWIVFKRGDIFTDPKPIIRADRSQGGISEQLPLVFTAYGPGNVRPQFFRAADGLNIWGHLSRPDFGNIILSGLHFKTRPGLGSTGIRILYGGKNLVIEDNYIEGMGVGLIIQSDPSAVLIEKVAVRDNVITDSASGPGDGGHSQNIYSSYTKDMVIENNLLDRGGYFGSRDTGLPNTIVSCRNADGASSREEDYVVACPAGTTPIYADTFATIFNHNMYLQSDGHPSVVRNNIISRASSHGLQARSGARIENNLFTRNPLGTFVGYAGQEHDFNAYADYWSVIAENAVLEGNDINSTLPRGFGIEHNTAHHSLIFKNIIANTYDRVLRYNKVAINLVCRNTAYVAGSPRHPCTTNISHNIVYDWRDAQAGTPLRISLNANETDYNNISILLNNFQAESTGNTRTMIEAVNSDTLTQALGRIRFDFNKYTTANPSQIRFTVGGNPATRTFAEWNQQGFERYARAFNTVTHPDPCRTVATYYDDVILGNRTNDNCTIMHDDNLYERFMDAAKVAKNRRNMDNRYGTQAVLNYIRAGFAL